MSAADLPTRLVRILERERRASAQSLREMHALALEERVDSGEAVRHLATVAERDGRIELRCPENLSRFRAGDLLWLSDGDRIAAGQPVVFLGHDPLTDTVQVEIDRYAQGTRLAGAGELVLDRRELDLTERTIAAVRGVFERPEFAHARRLLAGDPVPEPAPVAVAGAAEAAAAGLDDAQSAAFVQACGSPFALVQGPPGAGKTRLSAAVARAYAAKGRSVLVTAFTHRAVNNVLAAIAAAGAGVPILKVGGRAQSDDLAALGVTLLPSGRALGRAAAPVVVGATTHAAATLLGRRFDLVLVDEAGQVSLPHGAAALALGRRHLIVGDHRQLPPLVVAEHEDALARCSLFLHLHERLGSTLLDRTYRMNTELCRLPSEAFYDGRLVAAPGNAARRLVLAGDPGPVLAADPPGVIVPMDHSGARTLAPEEARVAADLIARAIECGLAPEEAAVIAPHRAQGNRIRALLRRRLPDLPPERLPVVDTVERLQGGERDLIVFSLTASEPAALLGEAAFLFSPNRLNVALTRARRKLVILASPVLRDAYPDDPEALRGADLLRRIWRSYPSVRA